MDDLNFLSHSCSPSVFITAAECNYISQKTDLKLKVYPLLDCTPHRIYYIDTLVSVTPASKDR